MSCERVGADYEGGRGDVPFRRIMRCHKSHSESVSSKSRDGSPDSSSGKSEASYSMDDFEEYRRTTSLLDKHKVSPVKKTPKKINGFYKGPRFGRQQPPVKKKSNKPGHTATLFPPIHPSLGRVGQRVMSAQEHRIKDLNNQLCELQQRWDSAMEENRLLRNVQSRHRVALQQFQDTQSGLPQILAKHGKEVHTLQELLRKTQAQRNSLQRRLHSTENHLQRTSDELHRLQQLCKQRHLGEREELSQQVEKLALELDRKNKRLKELERNLELNNASFHRHLTTEMKKTTEAKDLSNLLQDQINQLSKKIKEKERELEILNIYSNRFPKGKKGATESKYIQTQDPCPLASEAPVCKLEIEFESEEHLQKELDKQRSYRSLELCPSGSDAETEDKNSARGLTNNGTLDNSAATDGTWVFEPASVGDSQTQIGATIDDDNSDNDEDDMNEDGEREAICNPLLGLVSELTSSTHAETGLCIDKHLDVNHQPGVLKLNIPRVRRHYTFKETIQNLHRGKPAYGPPKGSRGAVMTLRPDVDGDSIYEPSSSLGLAAGKRNVADHNPDVGEEVQRRKRELMKELFGQPHSLVDEPDGGQTATTKNMSKYSSDVQNQFCEQDQDQDSTSAYILGDFKPPQSYKIIFD